jgi:TolB-like protein/Tfp pilus assembly protein PilF/predicted Ser/Thr protein kinase
MRAGAELVGSLIHQYKVIERLGAGGMGEVFLAEDTKLGRRVALKFLASAGDTSHEARRRLVREAQLAAQLRSPHIAVAYDLVEDKDALFIAMEYVEGELVSARIARGPLSVGDSLDIAAQVADALDEAHGNGIVHRDIKSANLMLTPRQLVKVLDFGLAKSIRAQAADQCHTQASVTMAGVVVGTFNYMAPEQLRGQDVDHRADLFSLGVVIYEMLTARLPFSGDTMAQVADNVLNREPEAVTRYSYGVPDDVEAIVRKALQKDLAFRYQSARALYVDLMNARRRMSDGAPRTGAAWRPVEFADPAMGLPVAAPPNPQRSVAVLAFANITGDPADEWISQGIAESLTADFAKVHGVTVITREQIFDLQRNVSFGGRPADERQAMELGRRLGASWVVSGAYQRLRDRVRITAQAIDVPTGRSVATVKIDGLIDGIFDLQDRLIEDLVRKGLERELETSERLAIGGDNVDNVEAFEAFSRGMLNLRLASREAVERAIVLFGRALELEPDYFEALVALGTALDLKGAFLSMPDLVQRSYELLARAVALRPGDAQAHIRLGATLEDLNRLDDAMAAMKEGLRLDPDNAEGHSNLARAYWMGKAQIDEAIDHYRRALDLNREAGYTHLQLALLYSIRGDYDEAERYAREAIVLQDQAMSGTQGLLIVGARTRLGYVFYRQGRYQDAIAEYRRELEFVSVSDHALRERSTIELCLKLAAAYSRLDDRASADAFFTRAERTFNHRLASGADDPFTRYYVAAGFALRAEADAAWKHLQSPLAELPAFTQWRLPRDPDFDPVRADGRFQVFAESSPFVG